MTTTELIRKLKKLPETADVFFDNLEGGLVLIENVRIASTKEKSAAGRDGNKPAVVLSDS